MGCSSSKFEEEEEEEVVVEEEENVVQLCKDRKNFIKKAINQRIRFSCSHIAYIQSLRQVSAAFCDYVQGDRYQDLLLDTLLTSPSILVKKYNPNISRISCNSFLSTKFKHYLRSDSDPSISIQKTSQSQETMRIESSYLSEHLDVDELSPLRTSTRNLPFSSSYPIQPQKSKSDFFWDPFLALEVDRYSYQNSTNDAEKYDLKGYQSEEKDNYLITIWEGEERENTNFEFIKEVLADEDNIEANEEKYVEYPKDIKFLEKMGNQDAVKHSHGYEECLEGIPTFQVNFHRTMMSICDAMRETSDQFTRICNHAKEVSEILEASRFGYCPGSNELTVIRMLNPVNLIRPASSHSSTRLLEISTSSKEEESETSSDVSEEEKLLMLNHHSTLDRLYSWEKKLYEEIKYEEHIRTAYEKKYKELKNKEEAGEDPIVMDKTRRAIQNLQTKLRVSIRSIQVMSKWIERLRDEELHPQLTEMIQGLARFWRIMADAHLTQKHALDEASYLLPSITSPSTSPTPPYPSQSSTTRPNPPESAFVLLSSVHNWSTSLQTYITSQRSYARELTGWVNRCAPHTTHQPPSSQLLPIVDLCIEWSTMLDYASELDAVGGLELVMDCLTKTEGQRIVWDGMSDAFGRLAEFASRIADGYEKIKAGTGTMEVG